MPHIHGLYGICVHVLWTDQFASNQALCITNVYCICKCTHQQTLVLTAPQWSLVSLTLVVNVPTTPVLNVRSTTVVGAMPSTMMIEAIMSLISVAHQPHVGVLCTLWYTGVRFILAYIFHTSSAPTSTCPDGTPMVSCFNDPCGECPNYPNARCEVNYCGECNAVYYDESGKNVTDYCKTFTGTIKGTFTEN